MKSRALWMILSNAITVICFGWLMIAFWDANQEMAGMMYDGKESFYLTIPLIPLLVAVILGVISYLAMKRYSGGKLSLKSLMLPPEFSEQDERERDITAKACRKAYISLSYTLPIAAGLMTFQPIIGRIFPYFSLCLILVIPFVQWLSYYTTVRRLQN